MNNTKLQKDDRSNFNNHDSVNEEHDASSRSRISSRIGDQMNKEKKEEQSNEISMTNQHDEYRRDDATDYDDGDETRNAQTTSIIAATDSIIHDPIEFWKSWNERRVCFEQGDGKNLHEDGCTCFEGLGSVM
jgi:hypothetical protein